MSRGSGNENGEPNIMVDTIQQVSKPYPASSRLAVAEPPTVKSAPDAVTPADQVPSVSPRLNVDPVIGLIVQFLSSSGSVESQSPTFAAEAYIRAGLSPDGFSKDDVGNRTQVTA